MTLTVDKLQEIRRSLLDGKAELETKLAMQMGAIEMIEHLIVQAKLPDKPAEVTQPAAPQDAGKDPIQFPPAEATPQP